MPRQALQLAVAMALCAVLALHSDIRRLLYCRSSWSGVTAVLVVEATCGATYRKGALRLMGTLVGGLASIAILLATEFLPNTGPRQGVIVLLIALWSGLVKFVQDKRGGCASYAYIVANLTTALLVLGEDPSADLVLPSALQRLVSVTFGTLAAMLCVTLLLPVRSRDQPEAALATAVHGVHTLGGAILSLFVAHVQADGSSLQQFRSLVRAVRESLAKVEAAVPLTRWEPACRTFLSPADCQQVALHLDRVLCVFLFLGDLVHCDCADDGMVVHDALQPIIGELELCLEDIRLRILRKRPCLAEGVGTAEFQAATDHFRAATKGGQCGDIAPALVCALRCIAQHLEQVYILLGCHATTCQPTATLLSVHPESKDEFVAE